MKNFTSLFTLLILFYCCKAAAQNRPNILWLSVEDISPDLPMYGDSTAKTPNLDALAAESIVYENAFTVVGVCAPTRSAIITGMQPTAIGTMHMRTAKDMMSWGKREYKNKIPVTDINGDTVRQYAAVIPAEVKCFTEYLRAAGYYCTNNAKTDYQFAAPLTAWDENDNKAHWRNRPADMPFFSVFNFNETHESKLWKFADKPLTVRPEDVPVPPYFPDTETVRNEIARHYSNIELMDARIGEMIAQLKADGLYDNTVIFFFSDHGGPLPRQKRAHYESGLHVPFMVRLPDEGRGRREDRLVSFVDFAPTVLSLAEVNAPDYLQGSAFLGKNAAAKERDFIFGSSDRFDEATDRSRVIRTADFHYIYNFFPEKSTYKDIAYRAANVEIMQELLRLQKENALNNTQNAWFQAKKSEELYDIKNDPHNLHNLAADPRYTAQLDTLRAYLREYLQTHLDLGQIPEAKLIDIMWSGGKQPKTAAPKIILTDGKAHLTCPTPGASIAYYFSDNPQPEKDIFTVKNKLYTTPFALQKGKYLHATAERIGFEISETVTQPEP